MLIDLLIIAISVFGSYLLRYDWQTISQYSSVIGRSILTVALVNLFFFHAFRTYSNVLRFSSFVDVMRIFVALTVSYGLLAIFIVLFEHRLHPMFLPFSVLFVSYVCSFALMACSRVVVKIMFDVLSFDRNHSCNVFIYGAKEAGVNIAKALRVGAYNHYRLRGFVADEPELVGKEADSFKELCEMLENIQVDGKRLHTAIRYGVSQAILDAVAKSTKRLMCEVVADEYGTTVSEEPIPIFTQSGDSRYDNADKMILKGAAVMPHALINNVKTKLGEHGELLKDYVAWLRDRVLKLRHDESYMPIFHIDVYGTIGAIFGVDNYPAMADYLAELEEAAKPFHLRIEGPMDAEEREKQMLCLKGLREEVDRRGIQVELVADEWCNTLEDVKYFADNKAGHMAQIKTPDLGGINNIVEAVLYCKEKGFGAYQGGTCNETDRSAQVCVNCAMATKPDQILAKPGMGVDEGYMIVYNEMERILALRKAGR